MKQYLKGARDKRQKAFRKPAEGSETESAKRGLQNFSRKLHREKRRWLIMKANEIIEKIEEKISRVFCRKLG